MAEELPTAEVVDWEQLPYTVVEEKSFEPERIDLTCGTLKVDLDHRCCGSVTLGGQNLAVRKMTVYLEVGRPPIVEMTVYT